MTPTAAHFIDRAAFFRRERRISLAMFRQTGDRKWQDQARSELERELEADKAANEELDLEKELF